MKRLSSARAFRAGFVFTGFLVACGLGVESNFWLVIPGLFAAGCAAVMFRSGERLAAIEAGAQS